MKIFLTGHSGSLGKSLTQALAASGDEVVALVHKTGRGSDLDGAVVKSVKGSLTDIESYEDQLKGADAIVHSAWRFSQNPAPEYERVNVLAPVELLERASRAGVEKFLHISSVAVYGLGERNQRSSPVMTEDTPYVSEDDAVDAYPWAKVRAEEKLIARANDLGVKLTIVRPGLLYSETKAPGKRLIHFGRHHFVLLVGSGANTLPYVHVSDVADLVVSALRTTSKAINIYNAVPSKPLSCREFARNWALRRSDPTHVIRIPKMVFRVAGIAVFVLKRVLRRGRFPLKVEYQVRTATRDLVYSCERARKELGWLDQRTRACAERSSWREK